MIQIYAHEINTHKIYAHGNIRQCLWAYIVWAYNFLGVYFMGVYCGLGVYCSLTRKMEWWTIRGCWCVEIYPSPLRCIAGSKRTWCDWNIRILCSIDPYCSSIPWICLTHIEFWLCNWKRLAFSRRHTDYSTIARGWIRECDIDEGTWCEY